MRPPRPRSRSPRQIARRAMQMRVSLRAAHHWLPVKNTGLVARTRGNGREVQLPVPTWIRSRRHRRRRRTRRARPARRTAPSRDCGASSGLCRRRAADKRDQPGRAPRRPLRPTALVTPSAALRADSIATAIDLISCAARRTLRCPPSLDDVSLRGGYRSPRPARRCRLRPCRSPVPRRDATTWRPGTARAAA